jgi:hypothetical protein
MNYTLPQIVGYCHKEQKITKGHIAGGKFSQRPGYQADRFRYFAVIYIYIYIYMCVCVCVCVCVSLDCWSSLSCASFITLVTQFIYITIAIAVRLFINLATAWVVV